MTGPQGQRRQPVNGSFGRFARTMLDRLAAASCGAGHPLHDISLAAASFLRRPAQQRLHHLRGKIDQYRRYGLVTLSSVPDVARRRIDACAGSEAAFNGSVVRYRDRLVLIYRRGVIHSTIWLLDPGDPGCHGELRFGDALGETYSGYEDPRAVVFAGRLYCSFTAIRRAANGSLAEAAPFLCELDDHLAPRHPVRLKYGTSVEKNWVLFEHDGRLMCIYSLQPYVVLRVDPATGACAQVCSEPVAFDWRYGDMRNSTPPVLAGDAYHTFFHSSVKIRRSRDRNILRCYFTGYLRFRKEFPFTVTGYTREPLLYTDEAGANGKAVVFPCGAVREENGWLVSYGFQDAECWLAWIGDEQCLRSYTVF